MTAPRTPFAQWLQREMRIKGFDGNQSKLANYLGTGASTVNAWLAGKALPGTPLARKLAEVLKVPVDEVLARAGHLDPVAEIEIPGIIPELVSLLRTMSQEEQRNAALPSIELAIRLRQPLVELDRYPERDPHPPALGEAAEGQGPGYR